VVAGADAVVTICQGLKSDLVARGYRADRITIMPNGVDLALFGTPLARDPGLAAQLGLGDGPVIGFLGSFYPYEGLDDLIAAMPAIVAGRPDARLLLVGGGPAEAALRAMAETSSVAHAIRFVGRVPHHEVDRYYALVDVVCYPRKAMRLTDLVTPLKPLEAMAQGKLVAASSVGGHRELIEHGVTGTLFAPDDPAALALAVTGLLGDRAQWDERRAVARRFVEQAHDWGFNVRRYLSVYQGVLASKGEAVPIAA
jgi:PEP-CTERM/exosortase A-associated glycosyltransferase